MLYLLIITDTENSYNDYSEDFCIGIFESKQQAKETAKHYLKNVQGFCDYQCTYQIIEKEFINSTAAKNANEVWLVQGWNVNENSDETDLIESQCLTTENQALSELETLKKRFKRQEWNISKWIIGQKNWQNGFIRTNKKA